LQGYRERESQNEGPWQTNGIKANGKTKLSLKTTGTVAIKALNELVDYGGESEDMK
jgi:hypothetical protein